MGFYSINESLHSGRKIRLNRLQKIQPVEVQFFLHGTNGLEFSLYFLRKSPNYDKPWIVALLE